MPSYLVHFSLTEESISPHNKNKYCANKEECIYDKGEVRSGHLKLFAVFSSSWLEQFVFTFSIGNPE